ncbi:MAG TPA: hypothetical protein VN228_08750, partial [Pyrinomonadaceae bacterium]|nr:hypothetical protein [Pyrinomonadaceae bacterium]
MDERGRVNVSGGRVEADPEVTLAAPRFDEKSVQRAQPAVPLAARARARPFNLLAVCLAAALAGAVAGAAALKLYQRDSAATTNADARPATRLLAETSAPGGTETPRADTAAPAAEAGETAEAETLKAAGVREEAAGDAEAEAAGGTGATG